MARRVSGRSVARHGPGSRTSRPSSQPFSEAIAGRRTPGLATAARAGSITIRPLADERFCCSRKAAPRGPARAGLSDNDQPAVFPHQAGDLVGMDRIGNGLASLQRSGSGKRREGQEGNAEVARQWGAAGRNG